MKQFEYTIYTKGENGAPDEMGCTWKCAYYQNQAAHWKLTFVRDYVSSVGELCYSTPPTAVAEPCEN